MMRVLPVALFFLALTACGASVGPGGAADAGSPGDAGDAGDAGNPADAGDAGNPADAGDAGDAGQVPGTPAITAVQASSLPFPGGDCDIVVGVTNPDAAGLAVTARLPALDRQVALVFQTGAFRGSLRVPGNADATGRVARWQVDVILTIDGVERSRANTTTSVSAPPLPPALP